LIGSGFDTFDRSSSAQAADVTGFEIFHDNLMFPDQENLDLGVIGDELAQELGEGWTYTPTGNQAVHDT
jgi:hypothetical protein